jgi:pimeloyl-ACP methyl ester carboxylesterase
MILRISPRYGCKRFGFWEDWRNSRLRYDTFPESTIKPAGTATASRLEGSMKHQADERQGGEDVRSAPPIGRLYDVNRRHLALHQSGTGGPAVVVVPGAGLIGLDYLNIHNLASEFTTSLLYDRAGTGWSDPIELPRTAAEVTDELQRLLRAAGVPAPYLLVGHSLGGFYVRRYAQRFPGEVAGLLLLDPGHEDYYAHMPKKTLFTRLRNGVALLHLFMHFKQFYRGQFGRMFAEWPDSIRDLLIEYHLGSWRKSLQERKNEDKLFDEVRHGGDLPDVPLIVLTAMGLDPFMVAFMSEPYLREVNERKRVIYAALAESVPRGEHRMLENAGHSTIHTDRPDAVVQAIRDLLGRVDKSPG